MRNKKQKTVAVSGGFDPIHIGHLRMLKDARALGTKLIVILNNDNWLRTKKGFVFMPEAHRAELLLELPYVDEVITTEHDVDDPDRSVCVMLEKLKPHIFANGGDRVSKNTPEKELCERRGIEMIYGVGGLDKPSSSSLLTSRAWNESVTNTRPWGTFRAWTKGPGWNLKTIEINPGGKLSLQSHKLRDEMWIVVEGKVETVVGDVATTRTRYPGDFIFVPRLSVHRLSSLEGATLVEVSLGDHKEEDITRYEDVYGRAERNL